MKTLIIAEKPSVARDIAAALGLSGMENNELVISHCIGHLVRLSVPEATPSAPLPIIPNEFKLVVIDKVKEQYKKLETLMKRNDISTIVNACDAGREGELIFRLVYNKANCKKPIERMWLQSMTKQAIQTAWQSRQPGNKYDALYDAAISRSEADWLYGINGSRSVKSAIGRVMTPTLAMITNRFLDNKNFVPKTFYQIIGIFKVKNGTYEGKMQANEDVDLKLDNKAAAEAIIAAFADCEVQSAIEVTTPQRKLPPMLFHLTSLQQVANKQYGLSASETLQIAQALYEKHKVITYPRTDADALPTDYVDTVKTTLSQLSKLSTHAKNPITENWIDGNSRVFNDAKISDHFAIVPTGTIPNELTQNEQIIYDLIVKRFIAAFYPAAEYLQTVRHTTLREGDFKSTGRILKSSGWLAVYGGTDEEEDNEPKLPLLMENEKPIKEFVRLHEGQTKPPALFTEATLLKAMEMAGKEIDDEDLANSLKGKGIGTPATRAAIIEKLKSPGTSGAYVELQKKSLIPTQKGINLVDHLSKLSPTFLSPELTGEWEFKLNQIEKQKFTREDFMLEINQAVHELVASLQSESSPLITSATIGQCPVCKEHDLIDRKFSHMCQCGFKVNKEIAGYKLNDQNLSDIVQFSKTQKIKTFKSKAGKNFTASLVVDRESKKLSFKF